MQNLEDISHTPVIECLHTMYSSKVKQKKTLNIPPNLKHNTNIPKYLAPCLLVYCLMFITL